MVLLAASDDESKAGVAGPRNACPIRQVPAGRILDLLEASGTLEANVGTEGERVAASQTPAAPFLSALGGNSEIPAIEGVWLVGSRVPSVKHETVKSTPELNWTERRHYWPEMGVRISPESPRGPFSPTT